MNKLPTTKSAKVILKTATIASMLALTAAVSSMTAHEAFAARPANEKSANYLEAARGYFTKNEWRAAIVELKNALQADPNNVDARVLLGEAHLRMRNGPAAEKEFLQALQRGGNRTDIVLRLGEAYLIQRKFEQVLNEVRVEAAPKDRRYEALILRGSAYLGLRQLEEAEKAYVDAEGFEPKDPAAKIGLARVLLIKRDVKAAQDKVEEALKYAPQNVEALLIRGEIARNDNELKSAYGYFDAAVNAEPENLPARLGRASTLVDLERLDEAQSDVDYIFKAVPDHPMAHYLAARIDWGKRNVPGARDHLQAAGVALENFLPAMFLNGLVSYAENNLEQAAFHMSRVLQMAPNHVAARRVLGMTYMKQNDAQQAVQVLEPLVTNNQADAQVYSILGYAHMQLGELDRGAYYFDKAVKEDPEQQGSRTRLAVSKLALGDFDAAEEELQQVLEKDPKALQASIILAMVHIRNNEPDEALKVAGDLKKNYPDNPVGSYLAGEAYLKKGDYNKARAVLAEAQKVNPGNYAPTLKLAQIDLAENKLDDAEKKYKEILIKKADHVPAMVGLAEIASKRGNNEAAISWLNKAAEVDSRNVNVRLQLISHYIETREFEKAQELATRLTQNFPDEPVAYEALGKIQLVRGDTNGALTNFERLVTLRPDASSAHHLLARAEVRAGNTIEARDSLLAGLDRAPKPGNYATDVEMVGSEAALLLDLIELDAKAKKFDVAMKHAERLGASYPDSSAGEVTKANIYLEQGENDKAIALYKKLEAEGKGTTQTVINLHRAYGAKGQPEAGYAELEKWLETHPGDVIARNVLGSAYISAGKYDDAIRHYETLNQNNKGDALVLNNLAWLYFQKGEAKALPLAEEAHKRAPQSPEIMDTYAWIQVNNGAVQEGLELLKKAVILRPGSPDIRYHLAAAMAKAGQKSEARRELQDLLSMGVSFSEEAEARALLDKLAK